jgi:PLP dependent protein
MSHDFEMALRAGADVVRVGTGIFGARPPKQGGAAEQS